MDRKTQMENLVREAYEKDSFTGAWLYPIGEDEFGRKGGMLNLKFGEGCIMYSGLSCKKL